MRVQVLYTPNLSWRTEIKVRERRVDVGFRKRWSLALRIWILFLSVVHPGTVGKRVLNQNDIKLRIKTFDFIKCIFWELCISIL